MSDVKYQDRGALFSSKKNSPNSPDMTGEVVMSDELLRSLVDDRKAGKEVKLRISAWRKLSAKNTNYLSLAVRKNEEIKKEEPDDDIPF